jgi:hypothetical protein
VSQFIPWFLAAVLACVTAAECGALQLAGREVASLEREREQLTATVERIEGERRMFVRRPECDARPDICLRGVYDN